MAPVQRRLNEQRNASRPHLVRRERGMSDVPFIYLLNRMEVAAHSANPSEADFSKHRQAVIDRVTALESTRDELARALEDIYECGSAIYEHHRTPSELRMVDIARAVLVKSNRERA